MKTLQGPRLFAGPSQIDRLIHGTANAKGRQSMAWRRELLIGGAAVIAASAIRARRAAAGPQGMQFQNTDTAVVFIDPQNDVLSEKGANWVSVGASVTENRTVENMERIFKAAKAKGYQVFISPHYFYPTDSSWKFDGPLETAEFQNHSFARKGALDLTGFTELRRGLAGALQALHRGRQDHRRQPPQGLGSADQRSGPAAGQAADQQDHPRRHAGEHVRRIRICASSSSAASRWPWSRTRPPDPGIPNGATAIRRR